MLKGLLPEQWSDFKQKVMEYLKEPVDMASLVVFRWGFGVVLLQFVLIHETKHWMENFFIRPKFNFSYFGFGWVKPLPADWMFLVLFLLGLAAAGIMLGVFYRLSVLTFFVGLLYFVLCEPAYFQNHVFLMLSFLLVMMFLPLHQSSSLSVGLLGTSRTDYVPRWGLLTLGFLVAIVYLFGALAKIDPDWFHCQPLWTAFKTRTNFPFVGGYFDNALVMFVAAYGVLIFELLVIPALLWPPTRYWAFGFVVLFNLANKTLWTIDIFPWLAILATTLFFPVDWPRRAGLMQPEPEGDPSSSTGSDRWIPERVVIWGLALFCLVQLVLPFRHFLYDGWVGWNAWGRRGSWRMRLDAKNPVRVKFTVMSRETTQSWEVKPEKYLSPPQYHRMARNPELIRQFSGFLAKEFRERAGGSVAVYADVRTTYNTRAPQQIVDSSVDLASKGTSWSVPEWVKPLNKPLSDRKSCLKALGF